ncbi:HNH endonuclease signature motif containing protein [Cedecea neteri]|uniref:HNH endonuclease signature motif containing protein n=1 Tax=Cedecea neteri TaxID=158822 RepID=UPI0018CD6A60|nr:HNH endonuclease signature motif containing protein [Cedecea neteri]
MTKTQIELEEVRDRLTICSGYEWEIYPKNNRYIVSEYGEIYTTIGKGRILKPSVMKSGYIRYNLENGHEYIHRIVSFTFWGDQTEDGLEVDHIDRNKSNNHYTNLRWVTRKENCNNRGRRSKK